MFSHCTENNQKERKQPVLKSFPVLYHLDFIFASHFLSSYPHFLCYFLRKEKSPSIFSLAEWNLYQNILIRLTKHPAGTHWSSFNPWERRESNVNDPDGGRPAVVFVDIWLHCLKRETCISVFFFFMSLKANSRPKWEDVEAEFYSKLRVK